MLESKTNISIDVGAKAYPVGAIYMSIYSTNPSELFGGEWVLLKDRFLLGAGGSYQNGVTGGSKDAKVISHNHSQNSHNHSQNSHSHSTGSSEYDKFLIYSGTNIAVNGTGRKWTSAENGSVFYVYEASGDGGIDERTSTGGKVATNKPATATNNPVGVDGTNQNMPPYLTVYMWKRVA